MSPPYDTQMETTPFPEGMYGQQGGFAQGGFAPQAQPYGQPGPFAQPTAANPFSPDGLTSPFAQPYGSNPFAQDEPSMPPAPISPFAHGVGQMVNPFEPGAPSGPSLTGFSQAGGPSSWGAGSGGYIADASGFAGWRTPDAGPDSFGSDPGAQSMFGAPRSPAGGYASLPPSSLSSDTPVFQDAWTPPDGESEMETGALSEDAFQAPADTWSAATSDPRRFMPEPQYDSGQMRPWDAPRASSGNLGGQLGGQPAHDAQEVYERSTAAVAAPPVSTVDTQALAKPPTPTETALGSVLVEGALLTPGKLETLRGIQAMLSSANMPRKLGELAVMFKFLSADQLLAALLVSRGLVSPQQIASLGRVKQELAATGMQNDLETLLIRFNMIPADQLHHLRQELAS
jgi:hypothetical protein